jgi:diguanylate cyclase (GGDEF)-like protein/PAS domain S-box-containing protein
MSTDNTHSEPAVHGHHFAGVFMHHPEPIALTTLPEGRFVEANIAFSEAFGYAREELIGRTGLDVGIWADRAVRDTLVAELTQTGRVVRCQAEGVTRSGELRTAVISAERIEIDGAPHALWVAHDITAMLRAEQELRARTAELETLLEVASVLGTTTDLGEILQVVAERAAKALGCPVAEVVEYAAERDELRLAALYLAAPTPYSSMVGQPVTGGEAEIDKQVLASANCLEEHLSDADLHPVTRELMERWGDKSYLCVPLRFGDEPLGLLVLTERERERHFSERERAFATALAEQATLAIQTARQFDRQREQNRRVQALLDAGRTLDSELELDDVTLELARVVTEALEADWCSVFVYNPDAQTVTETALFERGGPGKPELVGETYRITHRAPVGEDEYPLNVDALMAGEVVVETLSDPELDTATRYDMEQLGEKTCLTVPLHSRGRVAGFFVVIHMRQEHVFTAEEIELAQAIAEQAGTAWERADLYQELETLAITDGLTGLFNHRHFYDRLAQETRRSDRSGQPLPMLMIDIDDFKAYNDRYGHQAGDEALRSIARILSSDVREGIDVAARYGGEELAVLLPGALDAPAVAERMRLHIEAAALPTPRGDAHLTVSIGVAAYPSGATDMDDLVARADAAMYVAKRLGKNRVELGGRARG